MSASMDLFARWCVLHMGVTPVVDVSPMSSTLGSMISHSIGGVICAHHQEHPKRREHAKDIRPRMIPPGEQRLGVVRWRRTFHAVGICICMVFSRDIIVRTHRRHRIIHVGSHFPTIAGSHNQSGDIVILSRGLSIRNQGKATTYTAHTQSHKRSTHYSLGTPTNAVSQPSD